jgi:hypothetical protein
MNHQPEAKGKSLKNQIPTTMMVEKGERGREREKD